MANNNLTIEEMANFCKKKGFVYQAAEIYGGLSGFFDYGYLGTELKNNIRSEWWKFIVQNRDEIVGQDGAIITNPKVWKASGHVDNFVELLTNCTKCGEQYRADHVIEDQLKIPSDGMSIDEITDLIKKNNLKCPKCKVGEYGEIKALSGMLSTSVGFSVDKKNIEYLRPETAQSIFPNFKLIQENNRLKLPFGIAQTGKAYRNEISPRDFLFRCREFEQMELEYFIHPTEFKCDKLTDKHFNTKFKFWSAEHQDGNNMDMEDITIKELIDGKKIDEWHAYWLSEMYNWYLEKLKLSSDNLRIREHVSTELSHYSSSTFDIDYNFPFGFKEIHGMANRGQYDLTQHTEHSGSNLAYFDPETKERLLPRVIEPSQGLDRLFLAIMFDAYNDDERGNIVMDFASKLSPYKVAVFPLMNKNELPEKAKEILEELRNDYDLNVFFDKSGSIGRRYARQDEIGTPYCVTVDFDTLEKGIVTVRDRKTTEQEKIDVKELGNYLVGLIKK